ncbi:MAG: alpha/beta hydrolase-fold protein [Terracidiphilus sp.]|jgi:pimeloyl-ACP methyl ester carboxylesterase
MLPFSRILAAGLWIAVALPGTAHAVTGKGHLAQMEQAQETGFLNRRIELHGVTYRFQVYLPEEWRRDDHKLWPIILFLHGRGERGSEGMWQTQIGLPQAVRDHPERWPFIIVMPQCPFPSYWTDPEMLAMAMDALDEESAEFHGDPERTYLTGLSLGGYGAWELAREHPKRWAAVTIMAGGVFWSYAPERWQEMSTLPAEYARALGRTPIWLFHGADDPVVPPRESELMFDAFRAESGHVRLWLYQGLKHDCWTRAYDEPELPRWLLAHRAEPAPGSKSGAKQEPTALAERLVIPLHPPAIKLPTVVLDGLAGEYCDMKGLVEVTIFRQGDALFEKDLHGEIVELAAESPVRFFYPNSTGASTSPRLTFERDAQGRGTVLVLHDDRHEERWERRTASASR